MPDFVRGFVLPVLAGWGIFGNLHVAGSAYTIAFAIDLLEERLMWGEIVFKQDLTEIASLLCFDMMRVSVLFYGKVYFLCHFVQKNWVNDYMINAKCKKYQLYSYTYPILSYKRRIC